MDWQHGSKRQTAVADLGVAREDDTTDEIGPPWASRNYSSRSCKRWPDEPADLVPRRVGRRGECAGRGVGSGSSHVQGPLDLIVEWHAGAASLRVIRDRLAALDPPVVVSADTVRRTLRRRGVPRVLEPVAKRHKPGTAGRCGGCSSPAEAHQSGASGRAVGGGSEPGGMAWWRSRRVVLGWPLTLSPTT